MNTPQTPVTPVKQSTVVIAGFEIIVVLLSDGRVAAAFRMFCDMLGLAYTSQARKIQTHRTIGDSLILAYIETDGGKQEANVIIAEAIPIWLAGIYPNKVAPEAREILRICQLDAVRTIRQKFFLEVNVELGQASPKEEPAQAVPPKEEPDTLPPPEMLLFPPLGDEKRYAYQEYMIWAHDGLERHVRDIDACLMTLSKQMAQMGQVVNQHAEMLDEHQKVLRQLKEALEQHLQHQHARPDGSSDEMNALAQQVKQLGEQVNALVARVTRMEAPNPLTAEHQVEVRTLLRVLEHQTGQSASAIERELAAAFSVEAISQLAEASWGEIAAWLHQRLGWAV
ncbi:MAG TPA: phage antirepressor N-terminal domain-containing protein [Ktedonobacterales bacterium]|jgi:hypothetical protein